MCGISAIVSVGPDLAPVGRELSACHQTLGHRGPDGEGFLWIGADWTVRRSDDLPADLEGTPTRVAIAFRQLKIQDLSDEAIQPLGSPDGSCWIALNGEIYNSSELALELQALGHRFRTRTDTEVALAAYRQWGSACVERFNGMWALLIVDVARRRLIGSRDRIGIKPLYYTVNERRVAFASEPQALVRAGIARPHPSPIRMREFLSGLPPQDNDETFFQDVRAVPAATVFEVDLDAEGPVALTFRAFWTLSDLRPADCPPTFSEAVAQVRSLLRESVALQSRAAVPVGCLLSGGLDTSYVARLFAEGTMREGAIPARSFSIVFKERDMSELPYIWSVVRAGGLANARFQLAAAQAFDDVDRVVGVQGQPLLGQDIIAQYHAYRLAREHGVVVVLEGQGADEMLAGMPLYAEALRRELWSERRFADLGLELWADVRRNGHSRLQSAARVGGWLLRGGQSRREASALPRWVNGGLLREAACETTVASTHGGSILSEYLLRLVTRTNLPTVLQYQDRSSMAHGIEGRVPFLDHRLVEFCFTLPSSYKVHRGVRKRVLVEAARGIVPDAVLERRTKKTFVSKSGWVPLRTRYGPQLREMAAGLGAASLPWVDRTGLQTFVDDFLAARHDDVGGVWRAYTAWRWVEQFGVRQ